MYRRRSSSLEGPEPGHPMSLCLFRKLLHIVSSQTCLLSNRPRQSGRDFLGFRAGNLHVLLEFLRLKAVYERHAWQIRPLVMAHALFDFLPLAGYVGG